MERRFTAFLLPVLLATVAFFVLIPEPPAKPGRDESAAVEEPEVASDRGGFRQGGLPNGPNDNVLLAVYGEVGEPGGFAVVYDRQGGAVERVHMLGEPARPDVRSKPREEWTLEDTYAVVQPVQRGLFSFALWETDRRDLQLGVDPYTAVWEAEELADGMEFSLAAPEAGLVLRRTYRWDPEWRGLQLTLSVEAAAERDETAEPRSGAAGGGRRRGPTLVNPQIEHFYQNPAVAIGRMVAPDRGEERVEVFRVGGGPLEQRERVAWSDGGWSIDFAGTTNRFFGSFLVPEDGEEGIGLAACDVDVFPKPRRGLPSLPGHAPYSVPVAQYRLRLPVPEAGARSGAEFLLYLGPKSGANFGQERYARFSPIMDVDLTPIGCFCEVPGARQIGGALLWIMRQFHALVGNFGIAIVLLTLLVRSLLVPINFRMQKSMRAYGAKMAVLKPELDALRQRYEKDPRRMQQEMAAFQRKHKLFPPLGGCLPLFITLPVFLGLFTALRVAYELRMQPFFLWIDDLSQPDHLAYLGLGFLPWFNLLPIVMVVLWLVLQMSTPLPSDPQQRQMMKIMRFLPLLFGIMLYGYASGLMVYMITSSLFGLVESRVTKRILGPPPSEGGVSVPTF